MNHRMSKEALRFMVTTLLQTEVRNLHGKAIRRQVWVWLRPLLILVPGAAFTLSLMQEADKAPGGIAMAVLVLAVTGIVVWTGYMFYRPADSANVDQVFPAFAGLQRRFLKHRLEYENFLNTLSSYHQAVRSDEMSAVETSAMYQSVIEAWFTLCRKADCQVLPPHRPQVEFKVAAEAPKAPILEEEAVPAPKV